MSSQSCQQWMLSSTVLLFCLVFHADALPIETSGPGVNQGQAAQTDHFADRPANGSGKRSRSWPDPDLFDDSSFAAEVQKLAGKTWNLDRCWSPVQLRLGDNVLNRRNFYCTESDALKIAPLLQGESFLERFYVWCRTAQLYNSISPDATSFDVRELNLLDGDMILSRENVDVVMAEFLPSPELRNQALDAALAYRKRGRQGAGRRTKRKIVADRGILWPGGVVPYIIDNPFSMEEQTLNRAISEWEEKTCVRFVEKNAGGVIFRLRKGPFSCVTRGLGRSAIWVTLLPDCYNIGTTAHEIGHVLGLFHEHTRPDRDRYVTVVTENIKPAYLAQFAIKQYSEARTYGIPYDYSSVMHYPTSSGFGITNDRTIVTADPQMQFVIGQRDYISFYDAKLVNTVYCSEHCGGSSLEWPECKHGGYRNPNNCSSCLCPRGLAPPRCENPSPGVKADCDRQTLRASGLSQTLTSPGYHDNGFPGDSSCFWLIKTSSPGKRIRLKFTGKFNFTEDAFYECKDYVEIRYKGLARPGPRFCGSEMPEKIFLSHGNEILIQIHNLRTTAAGTFQVKYVEEYCGGCSVDANADEVSCLRAIKYDCSQGDGDNTCFLEEPYCCGGYRLQGDRCIGSPNATTPSPKTTTPENRVSSSALVSSSAKPPSSSTEATVASTATRPPVRVSKTGLTTTIPSTTTTTTTTTAATTTMTKPLVRTTPKSASKPRSSIKPGIYVWRGLWTACSATCGLCGTQSRQRFCYGAYCFGNPFEVRRCGSSTCPVETYTRTKLCATVSRKPKGRCFWNQCYTYKTYICKEKVVKPRCCVGTPVNGICQR